MPSITIYLSDRELEKLSMYAMKVSKPITNVAKELLIKKLEEVYKG